MQDTDAATDRSQVRALSHPRGRIPPGVRDHGGKMPEIPSNGQICYHAITMPLTRLQVQLAESQPEALRSLAAAAGRSVADLVREGVDALLGARSHRSRADLRA